MCNRNALGKAGDYYIKGWDKEDEQRLKNAEAKTTTTEISKKSAMDSLNDIGDLY
jgi:ferredoxin-type protein NapG